MKHRALNAALSILVLAALATAQDVASFEKRITVKKLPNGLTILICERPEAPVFSFFTMVDAGSAQDPMGKTGLAHMFEHMAFKARTKSGRTTMRRRSLRWKRSRPPTPPTSRSATRP